MPQVDSGTIGPKEHTCWCMGLLPRVQLHVFLRGKPREDIQGTRGTIPYTLKKAPGTINLSHSFAIVHYIKRPLISFEMKPRLPKQHSVTLGTLASKVPLVYCGGCL